MKRPDPFFIQIQGVEKNEIILKVEHIVNWTRFHRFIVYGKNGSITLTKNLNMAHDWQWRQEMGRVPKTDAGRLQLDYIIRALDGYLSKKHRSA